MTMTTPTPIRRRTTGRTHAVGHFELPVPDPEADAMLPAPIREARAKMLELAQADNAAQGAIFTTSQAIPTAEKLDAEKLGAAIIAGQKDPGPVHLSAAHAAHAEAQRQADGIAQALKTAREDYWNATRDTDRTEAVDALEAAAAAELAKADDALVTVVAAFATYRGLRALASSLATFPEVAMGSNVDVQAATRAVQTIRDQFTAMAPEHEAPEARGSTTRAPAFTSDAYTPPAA